MVKRAVALLLSATFVLALACESGSYDVVVRFEPPALAADVVRLEVSFVRGSCAALDVAERAPASAVTASARHGEAFASFGDLEPGPYALHARGTSAACAPVAAGCRDVTLQAGGEGELVVVARPVDGPGCPVGVACVDGVCGGVTMDAGTDGGGPMDATTPMDSPLDAPAVDARAVDSASMDAPGTDAGPDASCGECMPSDVVACPTACGQIGTRTCDATCTWGPCTVAADPSTVALWTFDGEPDTSTITDSAGSHDGTIVGTGATWAAGPRGCGMAMETTGATGLYGVVPDSPDWDLVTGAIDVWARFDSTGATMGIVSRDASGEALPGHFGLYRNDLGDIVARLQTSGSVHRCTTAPVPTGRWVELSARFGGTDLELVVDGVPVPTTATCTGSTTQGIAGNDNPWVFSALSWTSEEGLATPVSAPLDGRIDQVRIRRSRALAGAPRVTSLVLVDASTGASLGPLADGDELVRATLPAISIRATTDPGAVGSVVFGLDDEPRYHTETSPPYLIEGDSAGVIAPWTPSPGVHVITVTPYVRGDGTGTAGPTLTARVTVR